MLRRRWIARVAGGAVPVSAAIVLMAASGNLTVKLHDECDPATFNAPPPAGIGPGTCVGDGDTTLAEFRAEFAKEGSVDDWEMSPDHSKVDGNTTIKVTNRGGENHTFTMVKQFGGGFVPPLNARPNNQPPLTEVDECKVAPGTSQNSPNLLVLPGTSATGPTLVSGQTVKFQCCIHPWMRTVITVK